MLPENEFVQKMLFDVLRLPTEKDVEEIYANHGVKAKPDPAPGSKKDMLAWWRKQMDRVKYTITIDAIGTRYEIPRCPVCSAPMKRVEKKLGKHDRGVRCEFNPHHYQLEVTLGGTTLTEYAAKSWLQYKKGE